MSFDPADLLKDFDGNRLEALVETMYLAADADGEFSDEEREQLAESIRGLVAGSSHEAKLAGDKLGQLLQLVANLVLQLIDIFEMMITPDPAAPGYLCSRFGQATERSVV